MTFSFSSRVEFIIENEDKLQDLKKKGLISVELGIENFSNRILNYYNKKIDEDMIDNAINILKKNGINIDLDFILFSPEIAFEEVKYNIKKLIEYGFKDRNYYNVLFSTLEIFTGTKFWEMYFDRSRFNKYYSKLYIYDLIKDKRVKLLLQLAIDFKEKYLDKITTIISKQYYTNYEKILIDKIKIIPYEFMIKSIDFIEKNTSNICNVDNIRCMIEEALQIEMLFFLLKCEDNTHNIYTLLKHNIVYKSIDECLLL